MRLQEQVYQVYKAHIAAHPEANRHGALTAKTALEKSPLNWNGIIEKTVQIPKIFAPETIAHFRQIVDTSYRIFGKVIRQYRENADYRRLFPFPKELEDLILLPVTYPSLLPIARIDIFYQEDSGDFQFCEVNTDGTSGMLADLELRKILQYNPAHQAAIRQFDLQPFELFDSWVHTFLFLYNGYPKKRPNPYVAIVDFLENATFKEFEEFVRRFEKFGVRCEICDIRSLTYKDGLLYSAAGQRIDAIYRRAVTADIMAHYTEVADFLCAVREDAVFLAGAFATQIIHTKWLFYILHHPRTHMFLTEEEENFVKKHIPLTVEFSPAYIPLEEVTAQKDRYILKPMDAYASKGTYAAGREYSREKWQKVAHDLYGKGYVCQQYCKQFVTDNIDFAWDDGHWHPYINMAGLYSYNGVFSGILMRAARGEIITAHQNERVLPVFMVKK
ncbi:MAG: hypothetical protein IJ876_08480 [Elusimicrobiaceae bacterium]|nr:hypothetical protein [Elusimicrobiaceae bacterium]